MPWRPTEKKGDIARALEILAKNERGLYHGVGKRSRPYSKNPPPTWLPTKDDIRLGGYVKARIDTKKGTLAKETEPAERIWVMVTRILTEGIEGLLANDPFHHGPLKWGSKIQVPFNAIVDADPEGKVAR